jgi:uncharacterized cupredoxin-like copper-binding protein
MTPTRHPVALRTFTTRSIFALAAVALATLALVQQTSARTEPQARATATTIQVRGGEFFFRLSAKSVARPGTVTFNFRNVGHTLHNFKINGRKTPNLQPGRTSRLVVRFTKKGRYRYLCTEPGHAAAGMNGVFTVR